MAVAWALNVWATNSWVGMNAGPPNAWRGATTPVPPTPSTNIPSGVRGKGKKRNDRELIVRLADVQSREDTAEFLKAQLRLKHPNALRTFEDTDAVAEKSRQREIAAQAKREAKMRADAAAAAVETARMAEEERKRKLKSYNDSVLALMLVAAKEMFDD